MSGQELICLSSSDEDEPKVKKKKISPISIKSTKSDTDSEGINGAIICLDSDEDTDSQEVVIINNKENLETNTISNPNTSKQDEKNGIDRNSPIDTPKEEKDVGEQSVKTMDINNVNHSENEKNLSDEVEDSIVQEKDNLLSNTDNLPVEAVHFLGTCKKQLNGTESAPIIYKKFPTLIKIFRDLADEISKSDYSKNFLIKQNKIASESVRGCIISFKDVYQYFKSILECEGIELSKKHWGHVRKLEGVINKLLEKLKEFNEADVDFDAEEDSSYIKHEKYSQRLSKVYKKYCQILKKNPYAGRLTHERLDFVSSHYNEINLAISKKYKNNMTFPNFCELSSFISHVVEEKNLGLSEAQLKLETEYCFKKLGDLLQTRRKKELYEVHCGFIIDNEDPAERDRELDTKLRISSKEGMVKIEQVCEEFVKRQELGNDQEEIDCSDTNDDEDEEGEDKVEENGELSEEIEENQ